MGHRQFERGGTATPRGGSAPPSGTLSAGRRNMVIMPSLLAIWLLFVLLVPKRAVHSLAERIRATAQGHRVYVFAPPADVGRGFAMSGLGEGVKLIQVGLPVYLLCLWAEARGRRRRLAMPSTTTTSPFPPAPKAHPPVRRQYVLPPMAWRREWEATLLSRSAEARGLPPPATPAHRHPPPKEVSGEGACRPRDAGPRGTPAAIVWSVNDSIAWESAAAVCRRGSDG